MGISRFWLPINKIFTFQTGYEARGSLAYNAQVLWTLIPLGGLAVWEDGKVFWFRACTLLRVWSILSYFNYEYLMVLSGEHLHIQIQYLWQQFLSLVYHMKSWNIIFGRETVKMSENHGNISFIQSRVPSSPTGQVLRTGQDGRLTLLLTTTPA